MSIRPLFFLISFSMVFGLMAQKTQTISYDFKDFSALRITDDFEVHLHQTDGAEIVELEVSNNLVDRLDVYQDGKTLYLGTKGVRNWYRSYVLVMHIKTAGDLENISIASDAKLYLETPLEVNRLSIRIASDAQLSGVVKAKELDFQASSDGNARLAGKVGTLTAHLASDSYLKGFDLEVEQLDIHLSSDSWAELTVTNQLAVSAFSDAYLRYRGNPEVVDQRTGSDAWVKRVGGK